MEKIKGLILIPEHFGNPAYITDRYMCLFRKMRDELGFGISITDNLKSLSSDIEVVVTLKSPQHTHPNTLMELENLDKKVKLVGYFSDLHSWGKKDYEDNMSRRLDRCDVILCPYDKAFRKRWPQYIDKYVFFPHFFAPHDRYANLGFNEKPIPKCLLSGEVDSNIYPLRAFIKKKGDPSEIDILGHPGYLVDDQACVKRKYAKFVNKYFCGVATSSIYNYVVAKYFEIPAVGALLLADEVEDLKKLGFVPFKHYVPITENNVLSQIDDCLVHQEKYDEIRNVGMEFVRENHSINNRFQQFKEILWTLMKK